MGAFKQRLNSRWSKRQTAFAWVLIFVVTAFAASLIQIYRATIDENGVKFLGHEKANILVYDAVWKLIDEHHYVSGLTGFDREGLRLEFRNQAREAPSSGELYHVVLARMLSRFDHSHIKAIPKDGISVPPGVGFVPPLPRRGENPWPIPPEQAGHGMEVVWDGQKAIVDTVIKGSPADDAAIEPGSFVTLIEFQGVSRDGSEVLNYGTFRFEGPGQKIRSLSLQWPWRQVTDTDREAYCTSRGTTVIRFDEFSQSNVNWALAKIEKEGHDGVILDLRRNRGGSVRQYKRLLNNLLPPQIIIGSEIRNNRIRLLRTSGRSNPYKGPIAVLIGPSTSSAAEVVARSVQHHQRGLIIGTKSAGSVLVSRTFRLPDGGQFQIPVRDFLGPDGLRLEGRGVTPDITAASSLNDVRDGYDRAIGVAETALGQSDAQNLLRCKVE